MCAMAFLWRSEDNCRGQFFPSPLCVLGIRLGCKYPHLLSHLTAPLPPISIALKAQFPYLYSELERQDEDFTYSSGIL